MHRHTHIHTNRKLSGILKKTKPGQIKLSSAIVYFLISQQVTLLHCRLLLCGFTSLSHLCVILALIKLKQYQLVCCQSGHQRLKHTLLGVKSFHLTHKTVRKKQSFHSLQNYNTRGEYRSDDVCVCCNQKEVLQLHVRALRLLLLIIT